MKYSQWNIQCKLLLFKIMYLLLILTNQSRSNMRILPSVSRASGEKQPTGSIFVCKRTTNHHGNSFSPFPSSPGLHQGWSCFHKTLSQYIYVTVMLPPFFHFAILHFKRAPLCACVCTLPALFLGKRWRPVILILPFLMVGKHITRSILLF